MKNFKERLIHKINILLDILECFLYRIMIVLRVIIFEMIYAVLARVISIVVYMVTGISCVGLEAFYQSMVQRLYTRLLFYYDIRSTFGVFYLLNIFYFIQLLLIKLYLIVKFRDLYKIGWSFYTKVLANYYDWEINELFYLQCERRDVLINLTPMTFAKQSHTIYGWEILDDEFVEDDAIFIPGEPVILENKAKEGEDISLFSSDYVKLVHTEVVEALLDNYMYYVNDVQSTLSCVREECTDIGEIFVHQYKIYCIHSNISSEDVFTEQAIKWSTQGQVEREEEAVQLGIFRKSKRTSQWFFKNYLWGFSDVLFKYYDGITVVLLRNVIVAFIASVIVFKVVMNLNMFMEECTEYFKYVRDFNKDGLMFNEDIYLTNVVFFAWGLSLLIRGLVIFCSRKIREIVKAEWLKLLTGELIMIWHLLTVYCEGEDNLLTLPTWYKTTPVTVIPLSIRQAYSYALDMSNWCWHIAETFVTYYLIIYVRMVDTFVLLVLHYCPGLPWRFTGVLIWCVVVLIWSVFYVVWEVYHLLSILLIFDNTLMVVEIRLMRWNVMISNMLYPTESLRKGLELNGTVLVLTEEALSEGKLIDGMSGDTLEETDIFLLYSKRALGVFKPSPVGSRKWLREILLWFVLFIVYRIKQRDPLAPEEDPIVVREIKDIFLEILREDTEKEDDSGI